MGIRPQKIPSPDSQIAQDVLQQTEIIFQGVRKNAMHSLHQIQSVIRSKSQCLKTETGRLRLYITAKSRSPWE